MICTTECNIFTSPEHLELRRFSGGRYTIGFPHGLIYLAMIPRSANVGPRKCIPPIFFLASIMGGARGPWMVCFGGTQGGELVVCNTV